MSVSLAQLLTTTTKDEALETILGILASLGFNTTAWQSGSIQRTQHEMVAQQASTYSAQNVNLAKAVHNELAEGDWLTLYADGWYDNQRIEAVATQGTVTLTAASSAPGPFTINAGDLVFEDSVNGYTYRNITGGTLVAGGTLDLTIESEVAGSKYDVANSTITVMVTPLAGVTANYPDPGSGNWITQNGADEESDETLQARNRTKWATLAYAAPKDAYENWALGAHASVTRVYVDDQNPGGPGTVYVYLASSSGAVGASVESAVQIVLDAKKPVGSIPTAISATPKTVTFTGEIKVLTAYNTTETQDSIRSAIKSYLQSLPVGGTIIPPATTGIVVFGEILAAIFGVEGVQNATLTSPTGDISLTTTEVAVDDGLGGLTFTSV